MQKDPGNGFNPCHAHSLQPMIGHPAFERMAVSAVAGAIAAMVCQRQFGCFGAVFGQCECTPCGFDSTFDLRESDNHGMAAAAIGGLNALSEHRKYTLKPVRTRLMLCCAIAYGTLGKARQGSAFTSMKPQLYLEARSSDGDLYGS